MLPNPQAEPVEEPRRILLVEDDVLLRELLGEAMRESGLSVVEVANADEARRYLLAGGPIDLVFSDVEMPGSMDGIALRRWVRRNHPEMPLILTSGNLLHQNAGPGPFIAKPYGLFQVVEFARDMVDAKRGQSR